MTHLKAVYDLESATEAFRALQYMITLSMEQGDHLGNIASGVMELFQAPLDTLERSAEHYRTAIGAVSNRHSRQDAELFIVGMFRVFQGQIDAGDGRRRDAFVHRYAATGLSAPEWVRTLVPSLTAAELQAWEIRAQAWMWDDGDEIEDPAEEAKPASAPAKLRRQMIQDALTAGKNASEIAQAVNMRKSSVERVIGQLEGSAGNVTTSRKKAVNE